MACGMVTSATVLEGRNVFRDSRKARAGGSAGAFIEGMIIARWPIVRHSPFGVLGDVHGDGGHLELRLLLAIDPVFDVVDGVRADVHARPLGTTAAAAWEAGKRSDRGCWGRVGRRGRDRALRGLGAREKARDAHPTRPRRRPRRPAGRGPLRYQRCCSYSEALRCRQKCARDNRSCRKRPGRQLENVSHCSRRDEGERKGAWGGMASLPPDAAEQVRVMKALERDVLAAIDRVVVGGGGGAPSTSGSQRRQGRDRWGDDPAHAARTGMARLRRELGELEAIVEEQARPADRSACLEALAERRESHDSIRQILRDATLRAADAEANAATSALSAEGDERDELLGDAANGRGGGPDKPTDEAGVVGLADDATAGLRRARAMMAEELERRRTLPRWPSPARR